MAVRSISKDFAQARAILRDAQFSSSATRSEQGTIELLKLLKAREQNPRFEDELAERICGDNPCYPYRSSYYLTRFFQDLGFDYTHDGSTRRFWVRDVLLQLDVRQLSECIQRGLFKRLDYKSSKLGSTTDDEGFSAEEYYESAIADFKAFIAESVRASETVSLAEVLNVNVNVELLYDSKADTDDEELNALIEEAKSRFLRSADQNVALEKLWDAFERLKTYHESNKKRSATKIIDQLAVEIDREVFQSEFEALTKIGNEYRIRHHETDKKPLQSPGQVRYLFFRMLAVLDLVLSRLREEQKP